MLDTAHVIAFVASVHPDQARVFYKDVLGLTLVDDNPFALVFDANGVMLRVQKVESLAPAVHTTLGWHVPDIRLAMAGLLRHGVAFERYAGLPQDDLGIWSSPSGAQIAWFTDPDGNVLSLTQF